MQGDQESSVNDGRDRHIKGKIRKMHFFFKEDVQLQSTVVPDSQIEGQRKRVDTNVEVFLVPFHSNN